MNNIETINKITIWVKKLCDLKLITIQFQYLKKIYSWIRNAILAASTPVNCVCPYVKIIIIIIIQK